MTTIVTILNFLGVLAAAAAPVPSPADGAADTSPSRHIRGTWEVDRVEVDRQDQMHWGMKPGDPRLLGRQLVISDSAVTFSGDKEGCPQKAWETRSERWPELFAKGFPRPPRGGRSTRPRPADFEFTPPSSDPATVYLLCGRRIPAADRWALGRWVAPLSADTLAMHFDTQVLLVLKRVPSDAKPRASFPCEKAASPVELSVCRSFDLASWDRSVAAAYRNATSRNRGQEAKLRTEQKTWLKERDACKDDVCLRRAMRSRVDDLLSETDYGA